MIMQAIMRAMLPQDPIIKHATLSYIDDVYINEGVVSADKVKEHLEKYGLTCKAPEWLKDGASPWSACSGQQRDARLVAMSRRSTNYHSKGCIFNVRKLVGHFPVCMTTVTSGWDDKT